MQAGRAKFGMALAKFGGLGFFDLLNRLRPAEFGGVILAQELQAIAVPCEHQGVVAEGGWNLRPDLRAAENHPAMTVEEEQQFVIVPGAAAAAAGRRADGRLFVERPSARVSGVRGTAIRAGLGLVCTVA